MQTTIYDLPITAVKKVCNMHLMIDISDLPRLCSVQVKAPLCLLLTTLPLTPLLAKTSSWIRRLHLLDTWEQALRSGDER